MYGIHYVLTAPASEWSFWLSERERLQHGDCAQPVKDSLNVALSKDKFDGMNSRSPRVARDQAEGVRKPAVTSCAGRTYALATHRRTHASLSGLRLGPAAAGAHRLNISRPGTWATKTHTLPTLRPTLQRKFNQNRFPLQTTHHP